jgi:glycosyltransferase involved in cell wall biosynthesis
MPHRLKVLASAYACEPEKGSEPAAGWNWVKQIARFHEVWVITRANNRLSIDQALGKEPMPSVHWVYFDLPRWGRLWKHGQRGVHLYYYLWQYGAYLLAKRLHRETHFSLVNHVTFGQYWMPSFLALLPIPFIWGPVGGGESCPKTFLKTFSMRGKVYERLRGSARQAAERDPFVRITAKRARLAFATTGETEKRLKKLGCEHVTILPQSALSHEEIANLSTMPVSRGKPFRLVSIGRLIHWKGFHLGLQAFAKFHEEFPNSEYYLIGDGPERRNLERVAEKLWITSKVHFWGSLPRQQVLEKLLACDVLIHPSLHDSSPWVCLEAMAAGRPVICLDLGGPALQVTEATGFKLPAVSPEQVISDLTKSMFQLACDPVLRSSMGESGRQRVSEYFTWDKKGAWIQKAYHEVLKECP